MEKTDVETGQSPDRTGKASRAGTVRQSRKKLPIHALCIVCVALNILGARITEAFDLPLYLDSGGTIVAASLGGYLPGIVTGYLSNFLNGVLGTQLFSAGGMENLSVYYGALNVLIALAASSLAVKQWWKRPAYVVLAVCSFALIGGGVGAVLTWFLCGFQIGGRISPPLAYLLYESGSFSMFSAQLAADLTVDVADKVVTVLLILPLLYFLPRFFQIRMIHLPERMFQPASGGIFGNTRFLSGAADSLFHKKKPVSGAADSASDAASRPAGDPSVGTCRGISLRVRIVLLLGISAVVIAVFATSLSFLLYQENTLQDHIRLTQGISGLVAGAIPPDRVDDFLAYGEDAEGYRETEAQLYSVLHHTPGIEYVYVYRILEDGCHTVFDLDTADLPGSEPGEVIPFDVSFAPYIPALLAGEGIEPLVTNDTYGWLLTAYTPVYDDNGVCQCYAAVDLSMNLLTAEGHTFLAKLISLFFGIFVMILAFGLYLAENNMIRPINIMAAAASQFAFDSEEARKDSMRRFQDLDIHTGDEIENLYRAFCKTTEDVLWYITSVQDKNRIISKMQNGLILVLADMVESRDKSTGDHVRKTAAYVRIIMEQMRREGIYADRLTDAFMEDVAHSAPLHDVGKIQVSDTILNKPGRLTEDEFRQMQTHTTAGRDVINRAIDIVPDPGYLKEARNLAAFHHEKWDGSGYPTGLKGEAIPLSARIMAVADVFDALVSRRSYKLGMPFEKAQSIIREGAGSHFDPLIVRAFLDAEPEIRRVEESFERYNVDSASRTA